MSSRRENRVPPVVAILFVVVALVAGGCNSTTSTPTPAFTEVPIGPTPFPHGTVGQFGLRIDPTLLAKLPKTVDAFPIVEDADTESQAMDNSDLANTLDSYAAAAIGTISDDDWLNIVIGHFKSYDSSPATYPDIWAAWVDQYATGACSQANSVSGTAQQTIGDFVVDTATCGGGPVVYSLPLGNGYFVSMFGYGPRDLGRQLIQALY